MKRLSIPLVFLSLMLAMIIVTAGCRESAKPSRKKIVRRVLRKAFIDVPKEVVCLAKQMAHARFDNAVLLLKKLRQYGKHAHQALRAMLAAKNWKERMRAAWALGKLGAKKCIGELIERLDDRVRSVRLAALFSLKLLTGKNFGTSRSRWAEWWRKYKTSVLS